MKKFIVFILLLVASPFHLVSQEIPERAYTGHYLGLEPPEFIPEIYAPGFVSSGLHEHSFPSFSPEGDHILWTSGFRSNYTYKFPIRIIESKIIDGTWCEPGYTNIISLANSYEAYFAPPGDRIYFTSTTSASGQDTSMGKQDIWYVASSNLGWSSPKNLGPPVNTKEHEFMATVTNDLTIYYVGHFEGGKNNYGIYRSELISGRYQDPKLLPESINSIYIDWTPFISPDESYLLFSSTREGGFGSGDLYVSFRDPEDNWTEPVNLGSAINGPWNERYPYVSPNGKFLFFVSDRVDSGLADKELSFAEYLEKYSNPGNGWGDIYWVDSKIIEHLRPE